LAKHSCLGIHYCPNGAAAVLVKKQGDKFSTVSAFKIVTNGSASGTSPTELLEQLARQVHQKHSRIASVSLALGSRLYQTLFCHTHFTENRQLKQTLRFDIEEDIASDSENLTLCYYKLPLSGPGSDLLVYTLDRDKIQELLPCFEQVNLDALRAEPDVTAWQHYLSHQEDIAHAEPSVFVAWAFSSLYILVLDADRRAILTRSFVCASASQAHEVLLTELQRSLAPLPEAQQPKHLFYHSGSFTKDQIRQIETRLSIPCRSLSEVDAVSAFAAGAAIGWLAKQDAPDFRRDHLPSKTYLSARNKALYGLSAALVCLLLSLLFVLNAHTDKYKQRYEEADAQMNRAYTSVFGKKPAGSVDIPPAIRNKHRRLRSASRSQSNEALSDSASHTFLLMMQALARLGENFDLKIDILRLTPKDVRLAGSIPNLEEFEKLNNAISQQPALNVSNWDFDPTEQVEDKTRREFNMTVLKQAAKNTVARK
jgi:hypothetical protein